MIRARTEALLLASALGGAPPSVKDILGMTHAERISWRKAFELAFEPGNDE